MKILIIGLLFFNCAWAKKESILRTTKWDKIKDINQIQIFKPVNFSHKSGIVPIKYKAILKFNASRVLTVLADDKRKEEWMPKAKVSQKLEQESPANFIVYYRYSAPWPFSDRDFLVKNIGKFDKKTMTVSVDMYSVDHKDDPAKKHKETVRGTAYDGYTIIKPIDKNTTSIEMAFLNDFGGFIPKWIINMVQEKWPERFITNLRTQLSKKDIKINPDYILDKDIKF